MPRVPHAGSAAPVRRAAGLLLLISSCVGSCASPEARTAAGSRDVVSLPSAATLAPEPRAATGTDPLQESAAPAAAARRGEPRTDLRTHLERTRVPGFRVSDEESLRRALAGLSAVTGLSIVVDPRAEQAALDAGALFDLTLDHPLSARSVLDLVVSAAGDDVGWTVRHGVVLVTTADRARGPMVLALYDVRATILEIADLAAPRIGRLHPDDDRAWDDPDAGSGGRIGGRPRIDPDGLVDLVRENVQPESWDAAGASLELQDGVLVVRNSREVQARVRRFLHALP